MGLTMQERQTVTKAMAGQYRRATKKRKGEILDRFVEATAYNRVYAAQVLRGHGRAVEVAPGRRVEGSARVTKRRRREPCYGKDVIKALTKIWKIMDYICGKRLAAAMPQTLPNLIRHGEIRATAAVRKKLLRMSAATIDRLLAQERLKATLKGRAGTKPGTLLKHQIPVRTFADWNEAKPGFVEIDLVAHDGGSSHGEYCQILDATDVCTGWSEQVAVPTKAQCWVFDAIKEIRQRLPFDLLGLDSDNGSEFINHQLLRYCQEQRLTFTRSRACRKNDNCHVEQKNWSIVRRFSGYDRHEGDEACQALNALYVLVRDYVNFFMPSMKLIEKIRDGARVIKRYDRPQTPYQRVLASKDIPEEVKKALRTRYATLNPAQLKRDIEHHQKKLSKLAIRLRSGFNGHTKPAPNHPWNASASTENTG